MSKAALVPTSCFAINDPPIDPTERARDTILSVKKHQDLVRAQLAVIVSPERDSQPPSTAASREAADERFSSSINTPYQGSGIPIALPPEPIENFAKDIDLTLELLKRYNDIAVPHLHAVSGFCGIPLSSIVPAKRRASQPKISTKPSASALPRRSSTTNTVATTITDPRHPEPSRRPSLPLPSPYGTNTISSPVDRSRDPRRDHLHRFPKSKSPGEIRSTLGLTHSPISSTGMPSPLISDGRREKDTPRAVELDVREDDPSHLSVTSPRPIPPLISNTAQSSVEKTQDPRRKRQAPISPRNVDSSIEGALNSGGAQSSIIRPNSEGTSPMGKPPTEITQDPRRRPTVQTAQQHPYESSSANTPTQPIGSPATYVAPSPTLDREAHTGSAVPPRGSDASATSVPPKPVQVLAGSRGGPSNAPQQTTLDADGDIQMGGTAYDVARDPRRRPSVPTPISESNIVSGSNSRDRQPPQNPAPAPPAVSSISHSLTPRDVHPELIQPAAPSKAALPRVSPNSPNPHFDAATLSALRAAITNTPLYEGDYVNLARIGGYLKQNSPEIDFRILGYNSLSDFMDASGIVETRAFYKSGKTAVKGARLRKT
ncbi:hypothetical protein EJ05DRAFT_488392 [Pseudovirgaria hyperparasitica]|uniref:HTH OST-type domain-containing protein n=1 Tax=Pseudovirgaria hyperparasitica TaxID=470096 RepID=A0A6A6VYF3_9PEZI|nr:uncharacterized protein EJ05DRAFT_488392 [Pseudovirgaria hyperparasitica]KAF2755662.1 hypothetical protein EJ05DRAFT_488392 [Pseudovirgaria hyperparasitica]